MSEYAFLEIQDLNPNEEKWVCDVVRLGKEIRGEDASAGSPFFQKAIDLGLESDELDLGDAFQGLEIDCYDKRLIISDDTGSWDTDHAVALVCSFLKRFRPEDSAELCVGWNGDDGRPGGFRKMVNKDGFVVESSHKATVSVEWEPENVLNMHMALTMEDARRIMTENKDRIETAMVNAGAEVMQECVDQFFLDKAKQKMAAPRP